MHGAYDLSLTRLGERHLLALALNQVLVLVTLRPPGETDPPRRLVARAPHRQPDGRVRKMGVREGRHELSGKRVTGAVQVSVRAVRSPCDSIHVVRLAKVREAQLALHHLYLVDSRLI